MPALPAIVGYSWQPMPVCKESKTNLRKRTRLPLLDLECPYIASLNAFLICARVTVVDHCCSLELTGVLTIPSNSPQHSQNFRSELLRVRCSCLGGCAI